MEPVNPFKRPMNALQKQWYRVLIARRVGIANPEETKPRELTYSEICQRRYNKAYHKYNNQFVKEIKRIEEMQPTAIDAMRVHRSFAITTLWLPLHSKKEINLTLEQLEKVMDSKERRRLEQILSQTGRRLW